MEDNPQPSADAAVAAHRMAGKISGAQAAMRAHARKYEGLANVFRATAGGNAQALTLVYGDTAALLTRLADNLTDDDPRTWAPDTRG